MKRLLCITSSMNTGGAETFLMKIYRNIDREQYQFDFCVNEFDNFYQAEIEELGGTVHVIPTKSTNFFSYLRALRRVIKDNRYQSVMRVNQHSLATIDLLVAKACGCRKLVMRSSNASSGSPKKELLHRWFRFLPKRIPTIKLAPSKKAAEYTFGQGCIESDEAFILNNGLDITEFEFSEEVRQSYRESLGLEDKFVVGHVGRFSQQKNHDFLIDVFYQLAQKRQDAVLILIGQGELESEVRAKVERLGLSDKVQFLGVRSDVNQLLNAMDVFLFPSFFEGMPNTVVEAQTNGLPCVVADTITDEVQITDLVKMLDLSKDATFWSDNLLQLSENHQEDWRVDYALIMRSQGYDIKDCATRFVEMIFC